MKYNPSIFLFLNIFELNKDFPLGIYFLYLLCARHWDRALTENPWTCENFSLLLHNFPFLFPLPQPLVYVHLCSFSVFPQSACIDFFFPSLWTFRDTELQQIMLWSSVFINTASVSVTAVICLYYRWRDTSVSVFDWVGVYALWRNKKNEIFVIPILKQNVWLRQNVTKWCFSLWGSPLLECRNRITAYRKTVLRVSKSYKGVYDSSEIINWFYPFILRAYINVQILRYIHMLYISVSCCLKSFFYSFKISGFSISIAIH